MIILETMTLLDKRLPVNCCIYICVYCVLCVLLPFMTIVATAVKLYIEVRAAVTIVFIISPYEDCIYKCKLSAYISVSCVYEVFVLCGTFDV